MSSVHESEDKKNGGCFLSTTVAVFLLFLACALAVGVGLIVFFAVDKNDIVCECSTGSSPGVKTSAVKGQCMDLAKGGDADVCNKCPQPTASPTKETSTPGSSEAMPKRLTDVRLPSSVIPLHYKVRLQPYMYTGKPEDFTFKGFVEIRVRCVEPTNNITLHAADLDIDENSLEFKAINQSTDDPMLLTHGVDKEREFFIFKLNKNMQENKEYEVRINYTASLSNGLRGFYLSTYERNNQSVYLATTQFEPTDARKAFPCFDEPAIKAYFDITLVRKNDLISIANTPINHTTQAWAEDGVTYVADVYERTPKMSTYLLAFIICDFTYTKGTASNGIVYRAFSRPEQVNSTLVALDVGLKVLPFYETYFGAKYPLPKQDMIAIPDFAAGAMENWGLITYRETAMLYTDGISNSANKQRVAIVVAHELAHQWFGDLVTPSWWDDLWLNEGFATFVEYLGVDHVYPDWKMFDRFVVETFHGALQSDSLVTSHPVYVPVYHPDEINEIFDGISYGKGGSIIRMMRHFLGYETFRLGLVRYLNNRKFNAAFHDDLWKALEDQARSEGKNIPVKEIMDTWTLQMNYPVVKVTRDFNNLDTVHVMQERFLTYPFTTETGKYTSKFGYKWTIPMTLTSSVNPNFTISDDGVHWLFKNQTTADFNIGSNNLPPKGSSDGWILANTEQNGFYRVNYDAGNWKALNNQLKTDHNKISTINRAQIINDAFNLAKPGTLDIKMAFDLVDYMDKERDYIALVAAFSELGYVSRMLSLTSTYGMFKKFLSAKIEGAYNFYGLNNNKNSTHNEISTRVTVASYACSLKIKGCTTEAVRQYKEWMDNPSVNKIDPDMKYTIYCTAISLGDWEEWSFALKMYKKTPIASEKSKLLTAMTCTQKSWILSHYLNLVVAKDSPIRMQDALSVISLIGTSVEGRFITWQFYKSNFATLGDRFGKTMFAWASVVGSLTWSFNTEYQLNEVTQLLNDNRAKVGTAATAFTQAIENIRMNIKWMEINYPKTHEWFEAKYNLA